MDAEVIIWALVYVAGYGLILGYLLSIVIRAPRDEKPAPPAPPPPPPA